LSSQIRGLCCVNGLGRRNTTKVSIFEPVAVTLDRDDFGMVDQAVDHGSGHDVVTEDLTHRPNGL
jgi:hypothetical protein